MLLYEFRPESDKDIMPTVTVNFEDADELDLYDHVENFKYFLKALSFPESLVDRVQVIEPKEKAVDK
jgi:hypothetical protein